MSIRSRVIGLCLLFLFIYETPIHVTAGAGLSRPKPPRRPPRPPHRSPPPRRPPPSRPPPRRPPPPSPHVPLGSHVWCVTKPEASIKEIVAFVKETCKRRVINCQIIERGQPCHLGGNIRKQTSYLLHHLFVKTHSCYARIGTLTDVNPSEGQCKFPLVDLNKLIAD